MISGGSFPACLTEIDDLTRKDHGYLRDADRCYFFGEYTARAGYTRSATNSLILNFKKPTGRRRKPEWEYKRKAIEQVARAFRSALGSEWLNQLTFVPVPPSKSKEDPLYDDRLIKMLSAIRPEPALDIRDILSQKRSCKAAHETDQRPSPRELQDLYSVDEDLLEPFPSHIAIVDDLLTTGAHFRAVKTVLSGNFPETEIIGLFVARRVLD